MIVLILPYFSQKYNKYILPEHKLDPQIMREVFHPETHLVRPAFPRCAQGEASAKSPHVCPAQSFSRKEQCFRQKAGQQKRQV